MNIAALSSSTVLPVWVYGGVPSTEELRSLDSTCRMVNSLYIYRYAAEVCIAHDNFDSPGESHGLSHAMAGTSSVLLIKSTE